jgi:hypothetical protein
MRRKRCKNSLTKVNVVYCMIYQTVNRDSRGSRPTPRCFLNCQELFKIWLSVLFLWDITPCSPLKANRSFGGTLLVTCFMLVSWWAYSSTLNMEATCSSETTFDFQRTTKRYIIEDRTLHNHCCENLKSCIKYSYSIYLHDCDTSLTHEYLTLTLYKNLHVASAGETSRGFFLVVAVQEHFNCRCREVVKLFRFLLSPYDLNRYLQQCTKLHFSLISKYMRSRKMMYCFRRSWCHKSWKSMA